MLDYDKIAWYLFRQFPLVITLLQLIPELDKDCAKKLLEKVPLVQFPDVLKIDDLEKCSFLIATIDSSEKNKVLIRSNAANTNPQTLFNFIKNIYNTNPSQALGQKIFNLYLELIPIHHIFVLEKEDFRLLMQHLEPNNRNKVIDIIATLIPQNFETFLSILAPLNQQECIALLSSLTRDAGNEAKIKSVFIQMSDDLFSAVIQGVLKGQPPFSDVQFQRLCTSDITPKVTEITENSKEFGAHKDTLTFIIIIERYIKNLEQDVKNHKNLQGILIEDYFKDLTKNKIRIMKEALNKISTEGIQSALEYLEADPQQKTLSENRNSTWVKLAQAIFTVGTIYLYRMVKTMLGYPVTQAQSQLGLFRKNSDKFKPTPSPKPKN